MHSGWVLRETAQTPDPRPPCNNNTKECMLPSRRTVKSRKMRWFTMFIIAVCVTFLARRGASFKATKHLDTVYTDIAMRV